MKTLILLLISISAAHADWVTDYSANFNEAHKGGYTQQQIDHNRSSWNQIQIYQQQQQMEQLHRQQMMDHEANQIRINELQDALRQLNH